MEEKLAIGVLFFRQEKFFLGLRALLAVISDWCWVAMEASGKHELLGDVRPVSADEIWDFVAHGIAG